MQQGSDYFRTILTAVGALAALKAVLVLLVDEDRLKELTFAVLVALLTIAVLVALAGSILRSRHGDADPVPQWVISVNGWMVFVCCFAIGAWALLVPAWLVAPGWVQILIGGILGLLFVVLIFLQVPLRDQWLQNWLRSLLDKLPSPPWTMVVAAILIAVAVILIVIVGPGRVYGYLRSIISPRPPTVKIVSDLPLGGRSGRQSEEIVNAINLALDNRDYKAGEVNVEYEALDDSTVEAGGWTQVQCLQNALTAAFDEEVVAWIGPFDSGCAQIEIPILNLAGLPMISPGNTHVGLTQEEGGEPDELERYYPTGQRNYTHLAPTDDEQARAGAKLMQDAGVKTVYVLDDRTEYGRRMAAQFVRNAPDFDIKVLGSDNIDPAAANSEMKEIAQKDPAAIYYGGHRRGVVQLIEDKVAAGMSNEDVLFVGSDGIFDDGLLEAGDATEGVYITFGGLPLDQLPDKEPTFVDNYNNDYDPDLEDVEAGYYRTHGYYAACGYVATNVMLDAIEQDYKNDKEVTREGIVRELLAPRTHNGVLGEWSFEENGDTNLDKISVYRVQDRHFAWDYEEDKVSAVYDVSQ